jgi:hypothetical protein
MRYFIVTAKCGHVGKGRYIPIRFAVRAKTASEAASVARGLPRVKHHHKDAILSVEEVDVSEYEDRHYVNSFDPYLLCKNKKAQMQEFDAIFFRIQDEDNEHHCKEERSEKPLYSGKKRIRNVRNTQRNRHLCLQ